MKRFMLFGLLAVVIAAAGFSGGWLAATSRPAPPQLPADLPTPSAAETSLKAHALWGMTLGSKRVYVAENETETMTVEAIRVEKDRAIYTLMTVDERGNLSYEDVYQNSKGVWHLHGEADNPDHWEHRLKLPCGQGDAWDANRFGFNGLKHTCEGSETITVPAGKFDTVKVTASMAAGGAHRKETYWYSAQHGLIQYDIDIWAFGSLQNPVRRSLFKLASIQ